MAYGSFRLSEAVDVLFCIIGRKNTVKDIMSFLKQPQSTVSSKLQFLRKSRLVTKEKWKYEANWSVLSRAYLRELCGTIRLLCSPDLTKAENSKKVKDIIKLFDKKRVENIIKARAESYLNAVRTGSAIRADLIRKQSSPMRTALDYLEGLCQTDDDILRKIDSRLIKMKKHLDIRSSQKFLFLKSEGMLFY